MTSIRDQNGGIHLVFIGVGICTLIAGAGAWVLVQQHQDKRPLTVKESVIREDSTTSYTQLDSSDIKQLENTQPTEVTTPQPKTSTSPKTTPKQNPAQPTPSTVPTQLTSGTISFSTDGCLVTGTGEPGSALEVGAYTATKGGSVGYTLPPSGTLTKSSGGFKGMQAYGKLSSPQGTHVFMEATTIAADQCPAAG